MIPYKRILGLLAVEILARVTYVGAVAANWSASESMGVVFSIRNVAPVAFSGPLPLPLQIKSLGWGVSIPYILGSYAAAAVTVAAAYWVRVWIGGKSDGK